MLSGYDFLRCSWYLIARKAIKAKAKAIKIVMENQVMAHSFGSMKEAKITKPVEMSNPIPSSSQFNCSVNCLTITAPKMIWLNVAKYLANRSSRLCTTSA